ncbi:MAG: adenylate/guanylate cyclase domain-containing protein [Methylocella sp.]
MTAGVAAFITQQLLKGKIDRLEDQVKQLKTTNDGNLESAKKEYAELNAKYEAILHHGAMIRAELQEIVKVAGEIATRVGANAYSVLVPAPASIAGDKPNDLVFLFASGPQAAELRWIRLRVGEENLAGKVYRSGQATIASPSDFAKSVDKITDYKTKEILAVCLRDLTGPVGVAQFLNKHNDEQFTPKDKELAENHCTALTPLVATFTKDPRRLIEMGHAPRRNQIDATIMLVDLSHYKELFSDGMDNSVITDWLNQYFEKLCKIAMQHGGEIDQFVGDGVLLTFTHPQDADRAGAFDAAVKMRDAFRKLREGWMGLGYSKTATLFVRIGLSCGLVTPEDVGYGHARRSTVIGPAVNNAADACQSGSRDRDMIILTKAMKQALDKHSKLDGAQVNWENNFFQVLG